MKSLLVLSCLLFANINLSGQILITGAIVSSAQEELPFATILAFESADSNFVKGFSCDETGKFSFQLDKGNYYLEFSYVGMKDLSVVISKSVDLGIIQLQENSAALEEVVVSAQRPMIERKQDRLIVNVDGSILSEGNNTLEVLQKSPSIIVDQDDNISINGRSGVRIYMDGKDLRLSGDQLTNVLQGLPANAIDKIEIITNPSAKYEAQGNAGIIDIITKRGKLMGTNGSLTLSPGYGRYFRWQNNVSFNHRNEKVNIYGQYSFAKRNQYMEIIIDRAFFENGIARANIDMNSLFRLPIETHTPRIGLDYNFSDKTDIGILISGFANITGQEAFNDILTMNENNDFVQFQTTDTDTKTRWFQYTGNLNLKHKFSTKSTIDIDFDYAQYRNYSDQEFSSIFYSESNEVQFRNALLGNVNGALRLAGLNLDYEQIINEQSSFEAGWKSTRVKTDNDLKYFDKIDENIEPNTGLSNQFIYAENINAGYVNYKYKASNWNGSLGMRAEQTYIKGEQVVTSESFDNSYLNIFPSASLNYTANQNHILGLSLSRRLDRPGYNDLNPFRFFVNNYTFRVGNPLLTPQYTIASEINYTLKSRYYFSFSYGYSIDNLNRAIIQDGQEDVVILKPINIDKLSSYALSASLPINFKKWWNSQWNINASLNEFNGLIAGVNFQRLNPILVINTNHNIDLGKGFRVQLGGFYLPSHYASISKIEDISQISIGVQKSLSKNKGSIRLNFSDIFYTGYPRGRTTFGNLDDIFISKRDSRYATLTFSLNFGKQTVRAHSRRQSGVQQEMNRARTDQND